MFRHILSMEQALPHSGWKTEELFKLYELDLLSHCWQHQLQTLHYLSSFVPFFDTSIGKAKFQL